MCGIAGYVGFDDEQLLRAMGTSLSHRGPDDAGFYTASGIGLAHRRLSIIDLKSGRQPMSNEDQTVWTIFNGEIYNYEDIRTRLMEKGHRFASTSDTEVIVHLYEDEGLSFVDQLRGMFALAIWDTRRRRLVLARDRMGKNPYSTRLMASGFCLARRSRLSSKGLLSGWSALRLCAISWPWAMSLLLARFTRGLQSWHPVNC